ncbi:hypothetical protein BS614_30960 (plasmid) [Paenibacillus xylanexedens]|uniref:hypothetical protein n=1 Tax=Paenibacillus xylanexedens TaxID=528191 RepID=UPI0009381075|nr:hypothetical protein [Paenibacillus xylanexedens]APO48540.1 hypothetical protein BS614_30960 [Paenibacillus xylanexedens]
MTFMLKATSVELEDGERKIQNEVEFDLLTHDISHYGDNITVVSKNRDRIYILTDSLQFMQS